MRTCMRVYVACVRACPRCVVQCPPVSQAAGALMVHAAIDLQGYDATSHFETEIQDVMDMYRRITGRLHVLKCL